MSAFAEVMRDNPPRMVVQYSLTHSGEENFSWGVVGQIPMLSLIGAIVRAKGLIAAGTWMPDCGGAPEPSLVIVWHQDDREFAFYLDSAIPIDPLLGMLSNIESMLLSSIHAQQVAAGMAGLLGPDGQPMRR